MPFPNKGGGGIARPTMTSNGSLINPVIGDIWTIVTPPGVEASDYSMMQDRGAGPVTLALNGPNHTVVSVDIAPAGALWPVTVRDLSINLVSLPINTGAGPQPPSAPTIGTLTAMNAAVSGAFTPPASNGGSAITNYVMSVYRASDNALVGQSNTASSPGTLTGIANGVAVYCKFAAQNSIGTGPQSAASNTVTPAVNTLLPANSKQAEIGDSIMMGSGSTSSSLVLAELMATGGVMRYPLSNNQALSGQATDWMIQPSILANVNNIGAAIVRMHIGTNDIVLTNNTPAQIAANIKTACDSYIANGAQYVIVDLILPRNDGAPGTANTWQNLSPTRQADLALANNAISALASSKIKINPVPPTFDIPTHCMPDRLHLNDAGVQLVASGTQNIYASLVDQSVDIRTLYLDPSNLLLATGNPQLSGTGGTKTNIAGSVADSWTAAAAIDGTMVVVASKVANFNGAIGQRFDISGTPATAGRNISFARTVAFSGAIGDVYEAWIDYQLDAGSMGFRNPGVLLSITGETGGDTPGRTGTIVRTQPMNGVLRTTVTGVLTAARTNVSINFVATFDVTAIVAGMTVGRPDIRKVV